MPIFYLTLFFAFCNYSVKSQEKTVGCSCPSSSTFLEINNVRTLIHNAGDMWWDLQNNPRYEIPKGSGKHSLFAGGIWIGGVTFDGQVHLAANRYRSSGIDYFSGPLTINSTDIGTTNLEVCSEYDRHFVTFKDEIIEFRNWFSNKEDYPDYEIPEVILNWPAHGDVAGGYSYYLAPFFDADNNGVYNPHKGDYPFYDLDNSLPCGYYRSNYVPQLWGDQNLYWIFNDNGNTHTETNGNALGIEIHAQAFAFADNSALNNSTFYGYQIINRSANTYYDFYFGLWSDADLGYAYDDYIGSDVQRGIGYLYNGLPVDEGVIYSYGGPDPPPPSIGFDFLKGLEMDGDGIDNPTGCNESVNGLYFDDGIADNESFGMQCFMYFGGHFITSDPSTASEHYGFLKARWKDNTHLMYGGIGHLSGGSTDIPANYMFPGNSDACGYGQGGIPMPEWNEESENNTPYDRRFVQSTGPITFQPGEVQQVFTGVVWDRAMAGNPRSSVVEMKRSDDIVQTLFNNCFRITEGPEAPQLEIIQTPEEYIFLLINPSTSNNYLEKYAKTDEKTRCIVEAPLCDSLFRFQGYQVFQVRDSNILVSQFSDTAYAKCVFQCDIQDNISDLTNFYYDKISETIYPVKEVTANNSGIRRSFALKNDAFTGFPLNQKDNYYFVAIAYAHNRYQNADENPIVYNPLNPESLRGQKEPYKPSAKTAGFTQLRIYQTNHNAISLENDVFFYPNPANTTLYFNTSNIENYEIEIYNIYGKKILETSISPYKKSLDISSYKTGSYLVKIKYKSFEKVKKLIVLNSKN